MRGSLHAAQIPIKTGLAYFCVQVQQPLTSQAAHFGWVVVLSNFGFWVLDCRILTHDDTSFALGPEDFERTLRKPPRTEV